jgi:hypothetical protein
MYISAVIMENRREALRKLKIEVPYNPALPL